MATDQELQVQQKREVESKEESTMPARLFLPQTDIFETGLALTLILEMPDVDKNSVDVKVENDVLSIEGRVDFSKYNGLQPLYTERGPLSPQLPAFEQDRARGDQRRARGRGHDAGAAQVGKGKAAQDKSELSNGKATVPAPLSQGP